MRNLLLSAATAALIGMSSAAWADGPPENSVVSVQQALEMARDIGVVSLKEVQYFDDKWEIEGNDPEGKDISVNVDATTGAILKVDRW